MEPPRFSPPPITSWVAIERLQAAWVKAQAERIDYGCYTRTLERFGLISEKQELELDARCGQYIHDAQFRGHHHSLIRAFFRAKGLLPDQLLFKPINERSLWPDS